MPAIWRRQCDRMQDRPLTPTQIVNQQRYGWLFALDLIWCFLQIVMAFFF